MSGCNGKVWLGSGTTCALVLGAAMAIAPVSPARADDRTPPGAATVAEQQLAMAMGFSEAFEKVAADVSPSVVNITAIYEGRQSRQQFSTDPMQDEFLRRFFGGQMPGQPQARRGQSFGSGVIATADGYILTNNHVVEGADKLEVKLSNDAVYTAKLIGGDPDTDVAVIKIDAPGLVAANLGELARVKPGQWVLAIGSPFNLSQTVTAGIVSSVSRGGVVRGLNGGGGDQPRYDNFIQTDAAINPGNSGGPLVNLKGEVIGINSAIFSRSGGSVGIGFAIPINLARNIMDSLISTGKVQRGGFLGVSMQPLDINTSKSLNFNGTDGVLVTEVSEGSPAEKAGLKVEDIITSVDGLPVRDPDSLRTVVRRLPPGRSVPIAIFRAGDRSTLQVTLGESTAQAAVTTDTDNKFGVSVRDVDGDDVARLRMRRSIGVAINEVSESSVLGQFGVQKGDVIVQVGGVWIQNAEQFAKMMGELKPRQLVRVQIVSRGGTRILTFNVPE